MANRMRGSKIGGFDASRHVTACHCASRRVTARHCASLWSRRVSVVTARRYALLRVRARHGASRRITAHHYASLRVTTSRRVTAHHGASLRVTACHYASLRVTTRHCVSLRVTTRRCTSLHVTKCHLVIWAHLVHDETVILMCTATHRRKTGNCHGVTVPLPCFMQMRNHLFHSFL